MNNFWNSELLLFLYTFAVRTTVTRIMKDPRRWTMQNWTGLLGARQPSHVASARHTGILSRCYCSVSSHFLPIHVTSWKIIITSHTCVSLEIWYTDFIFTHYYYCEQKVTCANWTTLPWCCWYWIRAGSVTAESRFRDDAGFANEYSTGIAWLCPFGVRCMMNSVPEAT